VEGVEETFVGTRVAPSIFEDKVEGIIFVTFATLMGMWEFTLPFFQLLLLPCSEVIPNYTCTVL